VINRVYSKRLSSFIGLPDPMKDKAGSQKQGPQSPTPGFLPSNSIPESIRIREDHNIIQTKKNLNPSEKG
jgi:hypothetical protein